MSKRKKVKAMVTQQRRDELRTVATSDPHYYRSQQRPLGDDNAPAVERKARQEKDSQGRISAGHTCHDTLSALLKNGTIGTAHELAGRKFEEDFYLANLDPLKAADLERIPGNQAGSVTPLINASNARIAAAVAALGGPSSPLTAVAWEVLGKRITLKKYSESRRGMNPQLAKGLMVGVLQVLAGHYRFSH